MAPSLALIFSLLILTTSTLTNAASAPDLVIPFTAPSAAHHHYLQKPRHGHHRHHRSPKSQPPTPPPAKPPTSTYPSPPPTTYPSKPPTPPPAKPPTYPPVKTPTPSLAKPGKLIAVQGVVYCKNCTYAGINTLLGASPLQGATVELRCWNAKYQTKAETTTDKNGYFFLTAPPQITTYGVKKCRAYLSQKPKHGGACGKATNLNGGVTGALLVLDKSQFQSNSKSKPTPVSDFSLYTVGPFAYEPIKCY